MAPPFEDAIMPKTLKFVTTYGAPNPKRRRVAAACMTCRKRKTACSGEKPFCETCSQNGLDCAGYSDAPIIPQKRAAIDPALSKPPGEEVASNASIGASRDAAKTARSGKGQRSDTGHVSRVSNAQQASQAQAMAPSHLTPADALFPGPRNRMPYFRWLGPTAILPGFKQMVVKVRRENSGGTASSTDDHQPLSPPTQHPSNAAFHSSNDAARDQPSLPFYDSSPGPPHELIMHLADTFFTHLGCNYPFLQRERFLRDLEDKRVDAILVNAVCALAARFSAHPTLLRALENSDHASNAAENGHHFAQRAKTALTDTFACPSVAAAQAALLLAYNEFGEQRDSGLWVYLGIAIRMAQDLGLHKVEGLKYVGRSGPTPREVKRQTQVSTALNEMPLFDEANYSYSVDPPIVDETPIDRTTDSVHVVEACRAAEQERTDTFWAIFLLDRVVSSGTGRRSTLRDNDIELSFPSILTRDDDLEWPKPFPALIRIIHLYGRVADLLNGLKEQSDIKEDTAARLAAMELKVTNFYQGLSSKLHFDAVNFQHYMKTGEGTNFVLLHFWFHTLIVLLHQPTLLMTFSGSMLQLFPNSRQLSMSSAKTIADILSYSQLIDQKAAMGNPFTSQPIYIAACAFMKETLDRSASSNAASQDSSPNATTELAANEKTVHLSSAVSIREETSPTGSDGRQSSGGRSGSRSATTKHTLLATAASQHYQLCYKALKSLETYWAGAKYILTVLDQKFQGVCDPLLYTVEEGESAMEQPTVEPAFNAPGWRGKADWSTQIGLSNIADLSTLFWQPDGTVPNVPSPGIPDTSKAIGWALTGTTNSTSTNLAYHYAGSTHRASNSSDNSVLQPHSAAQSTIPSLQHHDPTSDHLPSVQPYPERRRIRYRKEVIPHDSMTTFTTMVPPSSGANVSTTPHLARFQRTAHPQLPQLDSTLQLPTRTAIPHPSPSNPNLNTSATAPPAQPYDPTSTAYYLNPDRSLPANLLGNDMVIASQDVDMAALGLDMMPWFGSYPRPEMLEDMYAASREMPSVDDEEGGGEG